MGHTARADRCCPSQCLTSQTRGTQIFGMLFLKSQNREDPTHTRFSSLRLCITVKEQIPLREASGPSFEEHATVIKLDTKNMPTTVTNGMR